MSFIITNIYIIYYYGTLAEFESAFLGSRPGHSKQHKRSWKNFETRRCFVLIIGLKLTNFGRGRRTWTQINGAGTTRGRWWQQLGTISIDWFDIDTVSSASYVLLVFCEFIYGSFFELLLTSEITDRETAQDDWCVVTEVALKVQ